MWVKMSNMHRLIRVCITQCVKNITLHVSLCGWGDRIVSSSVQCLQSIGIPMSTYCAPRVADIVASVL